MSFELIRSKTQTIFVVMLIFLALTMILTLIQPLKYKTVSKILIIQNFSKETDPYAASRSNQYLSSVLSEVIRSNSFYQEVLNAGYEIEKTYFLQDGLVPTDELTAWQRTVSSRPIGDTGVIQVDVYHTSREQAEQISKAVNFVMKARHQNYHGSGDRVSIKVIDDPNTSNFPVKPNIILNTGLALIFGLIFSLAYIYLFPGPDYNVKILPGRAREAYREAYGQPEHFSGQNSYQQLSRNPARFAEEARTYYIHHLPKQYLERAGGQEERRPWPAETIQPAQEKHSAGYINENSDDLARARQQADRDQARIFEELARARAKEAENNYGRPAFKGSIKNVLG